MPAAESPTPDEERPLEGAEGFEVVKGTQKQPDPLPTRPVQPSEKRLTSVQTTFSGPLPPPEMLKLYNEIEPGLAREIIDLAKGEAAHRQSTEKDESNAAIQVALKEADAVVEDMRNSYREGYFGQCFAFVFGVFTVGCATILGINHAETTACILGGGGLVAIISAFLRRSVSSTPTKPKVEPQAVDEDQTSK